MTIHRTLHRAVLSLGLSLALLLGAGVAQAQRHVVNGSTVTLALGHVLDQRKLLDPADFTVTASGTAVAVLSASFTASGRGVALGLARALAAGETATVDYTWPWSGEGLWTASGEQIDSFTLNVGAPGTQALTASFHGLPASHDASGLFGFELRFGEEIAGLTLASVESALSVTGGRLIDVRRTVRGKNDRMTVRVRPAGAGAVTLALAATADCAAAGAICGKGGRKLAAVSATVPGPADTTPPAPVGAAVDGSLMTVSFDEDLAEPATTAWFKAQWTIDGTGLRHHPNRAWLSDPRTVSLEISKTHPAVAGQTVTVSYSASDFLRDAAGNKVADFAMTAAVALPALTARFAGLPAEHDGAKRFEFELRFSEEVAGLRLTAVQAALSVSNGRVVAVRRAVAGQNRRLTVQVRPDGVDDVTVSLPATADCAAAGAICTPDGRKLASALIATVRGPVALSVADARAGEADEALEFTVTLSRAASGTVTVDYATRNGTATAGEDYSFTRGTLSYAAGELEKTVSVPLLDDAIDEGEETVTLKLMNPQGAVIGDGEATGTIENSDPLQRMWLARFGRTVADHVTSAVSDRLATPLAGAQVTVGGQSLELSGSDDTALLGETLTSIARAMGAPADGGASPGSGYGDGGRPGTGLGIGRSPTPDSAPARTPSGRELLPGSAFHLVREAEGTGPGLAAWGRVTTGGFDGEAPADGGEVRIDGHVTTGILGADAQWKRLLAGVAVSASEGEGSFGQPEVDTGSIESSMTTVSPYARVAVTDRVSVWGLAGWGSGEMTIVQAANDRGQPERRTQTDLGMRLAAVGGRGALLQAGESGGVDLALKADAFWVETESDPVSNEGKTTANASRTRLALEAGRAFRAGGGTLTPGLELGLRHDGGDAETGTGVELGGRVAYAGPGSRLGVEASVRALVAHEDSDYREWGASGALRLAPGASGRGLSFSLSPAWGAASGGADRLWSALDARGLAPEGTFEAGHRLAGEIGYGLSLFGDRWTGTPGLGLGLARGARDYRLGWRLAPAGRGDPGFELSLDATRNEAANASGAGTQVGHGVMLRAGIRW